jgi:hypothetical protein
MAQGAEDHGLITALLGAVEMFNAASLGKDDILLRRQDRRAALPAFQPFVHGEPTCRRSNSHAAKHRMWTW